MHFQVWNGTSQNKSFGGGISPTPTASWQELVKLGNVSCLSLGPGNCTWWMSCAERERLAAFDTIHHGIFLGCFSGLRLRDTVLQNSWIRTKWTQYWWHKGLTQISVFPVLNGSSYPLKQQVHSMEIPARPDSCWIDISAGVRGDFTSSGWLVSCSPSLGCLFSMVLALLIPRLEYFNAL